ncbi:hypothetical protein J1N35_003196 [Gossypium stocksii]|uniref:Reverse transcriptase zinc-binding domain-containing protein n=1 Tax=Gossypium stocksii TaxID=47602 RepID=A0A9D3WPF0_9ROSI|nr:hypothetical protein J1N35_003196 [Gossypium stocksii]
MDKYLGLPNVVGRHKKEAFQNLKDKIHYRIGGWNTRLLSQGGKEVLIKSMIQAIPTNAMSCFLLPKSFCEELENIVAKFWWQKGHGRKGIYWCQWKYMYRSKEEGGLSFRSMAKFNVSLLAKQGWRLLTNPKSLVARVLKAKYFPNRDFLNSRLGNNSSYTWKSIWASKGILEKGICWKVGRGTKISVFNDVWILGVKNLILASLVNEPSDYRVAKLIDANNRNWKKELIDATFREEIAEKIYRIPLAREAHDDVLVWSVELSGEFTVRSAYKLLQNSEEDPRACALQPDYKKF